MFKPTTPLVTSDTKPRLTTPTTTANHQLLRFTEIKHRYKHGNFTTSPTETYTELLVNGEILPDCEYKALLSYATTHMLLTNKQHTRNNAYGLRQSRSTLEVTTFEYSASAQAT